MRISQTAVIAFACIFMVGCQPRHNGPSVKVVGSPDPVITPPPVATIPDPQAPPPMVPRSGPNPYYQPPTNQSSVNSQSGTQPVNNGSDTAAYLTWLSSVEQQRQQANGQFNQSMDAVNNAILQNASGSNNPDPMPAFIQANNAIVAQLGSILDTISQRPTPSECNAFASAYSSAVTDQRELIQSLAQSLQARIQAIQNHDPSAMNGYKASEDQSHQRSEQNAQSFRQADAQLQGLLSRYPAAPRFSIKP